MSGPSRSILLVAAALAIGLSACGDDGPRPSAAQLEGEAAVARRHIPQGITLSHTQTGPAPVVTAPSTYAAGRIQCGDWRAKYVAFTYGQELIGDMTAADLDRTAHVFAVRQAAPGHLDEVQRGCRAGLRSPASGARP